MIDFEEAARRVDGRLRGVIDLGRDGAVANAAVTAAGTDVIGPDLVGQLSTYADEVVRDLVRELDGIEVPEDVVVELGEKLMRFAYRHTNGTGLSFFWLGFEMGRSEGRGTPFGLGSR